ncbi:MAG: glycoside hydrolase family 127 protein [Ruminococcus sp.]|nr:glycoside hydrolase family 127 protein [Ruminococcus sp.]
MKLQKQIKTGAYRSKGFIGRYQRLVTETVIPYQYSVLCDRVEGAEKSHVVQNFVNAACALRGEDAGDGFYGMVFQDSDAAKWIEAAAFSLSNTPDPELERTVDELIDIVAEAQDEDGYLDTYFTIKDRDRRWTNLLEAHELYCDGHFMEAACAYYEATGKRKLLDVMLKNAEHIYDRFVTGGAEGFPGHPEVELALMKMFRTTGDERCLRLAERFINARGTDLTFYARELKKRNWSVWGNDAWNNEYQQSDKPLRELENATGHAVRAVYLYTGMADLASELGDEELLGACRRLWQSITKRRMYVTGGIGSTVHGEAFSVDYDLPNDTAYAETCASCGLMFFASRMLENEIKGEYGDVMELAFYNTVLAGMQLDGKRFFYVNPLEVIPGITGVTPTQRHVLPVRPKWYGCACCPPNVARVVESFGKYAYGESADTAYCHLFAAGSVSFENGIELECETDYPYDMRVSYRASGSGRLAVRIPAWSRATELKINGKAAELVTREGYAYFEIKDNTELELTLDGTPRFVFASPRIPRLTGKASLRRGPLVYCFEGIDNGGSVTDLAIDTAGALVVGEYQPDLLNGTVQIRAEAVKLSDIQGPYSEEPPKTTPFTATAVPYYTWGNRGENQMRVWNSVLAVPAQRPRPMH